MDESCTRADFPFSPLGSVFGTGSGLDFGATCVSQDLFDAIIAIEAGLMANEDNSDGEQDWAGYDGFDEVAEGTFFPSLFRRLGPPPPARAAGAPCCPC